MKFKPMLILNFKKGSLLIISIFALQSLCFSQDVTIEINASEKLFDVSPYIYGKNNNFSDQNANAASLADITRYRDAGLRFARENSGNNATKYNWRKKLSSHPDWYNNVYFHDWNTEAQFILSNLPNMQIMYSFQLLGKVADNNNHNFGDWNYNNSKWWEGVHQNLAGGGIVNPEGGSNALTEGDTALYLVDWPDDSTTKILDHWFGDNGLGLNKSNLQFWSMDNEPEIWSGTHDDVMPEQVEADVFMEMYFDVEIKALKKFPDIKLCGPVTANEWQWYKYQDKSLKIDGRYYCWLEYFIKKAADKEKETGIRVLDIFDIHWYPNETKNEDILQLHRVFFDEKYNYPGANGVKTINGGWSSSLQNEFILKRVKSWLNEHFGENHGIEIGITEFGAESNDPNINATMYASFLGTFANNGVKIFSPWSWKTGMWEILHLYSRFSKTQSIKSVSSNEELVSAYSTINKTNDSLTVVLVNRNLKSSSVVEIDLKDFIVPEGSYTTLQIESLPNTETFKSSSSNALKESTAIVANNSVTITLPPLSTTAILLKGMKSGIQSNMNKRLFKVFPNPAQQFINIELLENTEKAYTISVYNTSGNLMETKHIESNTVKYKLNTRNYPQGIYFMEVKTKLGVQNQKFVVEK